MKARPYSRREWRRAWKAADKDIRWDAGDAARRADRASSPEAALLAAGLAERDYKIFRAAAATGIVFAVLAAIGLLATMDFGELITVLGEIGIGLLVVVGVELFLIARALRLRRAIEVNLAAAEEQAAEVEQVPARPTRTQLARLFIFAVVLTGVWVGGFLAETTGVARVLLLGVAFLLLFVIEIVIRGLESRRGSG